MVKEITKQKSFQREWVYVKVTYLRGGSLFLSVSSVILNSLQPQPHIPTYTDRDTQREWDSYFQIHSETLSHSLVEGMTFFFFSQGHLGDRDFLYRPSYERFSCFCFSVECIKTIFHHTLPSNALLSLIKEFITLKNFQYNLFW